jgi:hypothetical protein
VGFALIYAVVGLSGSRTSGSVVVVVDETANDSSSLETPAAPALCRSDGRSGQPVSGARLMGIDVAGIDRSC